MPGSIQVSVLGLIDHPSSHPLSSLTLKVSMGKREYHTEGGGELSFPVLSLRENLILVLHDSEGEEILRTEFRTMLLLERGIWDNLFPLKNGGSLHMKLQFSLSAEDQKRIREVRDSVLKKRHLENHKTRRRRSFSDEYVKTSGDPSFHVSEQISEHSLPHDAHYLTEMKDERHLPSQIVLHQISDSSKSLVVRNTNKLIDSSGASLEKYKYFSPRTNNVQDKLLNNNVKGMINVFESSIYQGFGPYLGQREKFLASGIDTGGSPRSTITGERDTGNLKSPKTMSKSFSSGMLSQINSQGKSNFMESFFLKKKSETQNVIRVPYYGILRSNVLKIDKKVLEVDIGMEDINRTVSNGKSTVFAVYAGSFSERKDFNTVKVDKGSSTRPTLLNLKSVGDKGNLNFMQMESASLYLNAAPGILKAGPSSHSGEEPHLSGDEHSTDRKDNDDGNMTGDGNANFTVVNRNTETMDVNKNNNEQQSLMGNCLLLDQTADVSEDIKHFYKKSSEFARRKSDENTSQNPSNELAAIHELNTTGMKCNCRNMSGDENITSSQEANKKIETVDINEINNEEQTLRDWSLSLKKMVDDSAKVEQPYQQGSSVEAARTGSDEIVSHIPSDEHAVHGSAHNKSRELECGYNLVCPIEILGTWTSRHLCITTGSILIRDFAESFTTTESNLFESSSMRKADNEQQKYGDAYIQGNESDIISSSIKSCSENSSRSLKSNGGLIEQVVQIVVVIVACGILLKSR